MIALALLLSVVAGGEGDLGYREEPAILGSRAPRVGAWIADVEFSTIDEGRSRLSEVMGERGLVVALRDPDCPLSGKYTPRLRRMRTEAIEKGFGFLYCLVGDTATAERDREEFELTGTYAVDEDEALARELEAHTTTEVFVLDAARTLVYRGMIDDQFGLGFSKPAVGTEHLRDVLAKLGAGETVEPYGTVAHGCLLALGEPAEPVARPVTYHETVSRILRARCESCHRDGGAGPFALSTYDEAKRKRRMLKWALRTGAMPPWFASEGSGPWANDASLTEREREDLLAWVEAGAPEGDPANAPLPREWVDGWTIGEPDHVLAMEESFDVPAEGVLEYQYFFVKTDFPEDRWVRALEVRPGATSVVHHVLVLMSESETPEISPYDGIDGYFATAVPGQGGTIFPEGHAKRLPAGAWLKFQLHYTPDGTEHTDRTELGLVFADGPPEHEIRTASAFNADFAIPPHSFNHEVAGEFTFEEPGRIVSLFPHTHARGIGFLYELSYPDGRTEALLELPAYDYNWQLCYQLRDPLEVPAGAVLRARAWYDNTADNPLNPDPSATVNFGPQTFHEMMIGYFDWTAVQ